jgi:hypothetical protein
VPEVPDETREAYRALFPDPPRQRDAGGLKPKLSLQQVEALKVREAELFREVLQLRGSAS